MRIVALIFYVFCVLFAPSAFASKNAPQARKPGTLLKWTDDLWAQREREFAVPGEYKRCGNYLFLYTPSPELGVEQKQMIGFAFPSPSGGLGEIVLRRGADVRIVDSPKGATNTNRVYRNTAPKTEGNVTGRSYVILLSWDEYEKVRTCFRIKPAVTT